MKNKDFHPGIAAGLFLVTVSKAQYGFTLYADNRVVIQAHIGLPIPVPGSI